MLRSFIMTALALGWGSSSALSLTSEEIIAKLRAAGYSQIQGGADRKDQDLQGRQGKHRALANRRQHRPHRRGGEIARRADEAKRLYWTACRLASQSPYRPRETSREFRKCSEGARPGRVPARW